MRDYTITAKMTLWHLYGGNYMAEKKKRVRKIRQEWRPGLIASVLYKIWRIAFAGIKIALGAVATVGLICIVCGFVFVNVLGDYLVEDVMAKAEFNLDDYNLDRTSYIYYTDDNGEIQILQKLNTFLRCNLQCIIRP